MWTDTEGQDRMKAASGWFAELRGKICTAFEQIEQDLEGGPNVGLPPGQFEQTEWKRSGGGGGVMSIMR